jgi:hypothetical protein
MDFSAMTARRNQPSGEMGQGPIPEWMRELPPEMAPRRKSFYAVPANFINANVLPAGGNVTVAVAIDNTADFVFVSAVAVVTDTTGLTLATFRPFVVQITDAGPARNFFAQPTHFEDVFGSIEQPGYFDYLRIATAASSIEVTLENQDAANAYLVWCLFRGFRVYGPKPGDPWRN